jgi:hypothetical protein
MVNITSFFSLVNSLDQLWIFPLLPSLGAAAGFFFQVSGAYSGLGFNL